MAFTITSSTTSQVKIVDSIKGSKRYLMNSTHTAQINPDSGLVYIINLETNSTEYVLDPDLVTTPAGPWTAETLCDTLNASPYFFSSAGGGGSVSPGNAFELFRTDSTGTATEWTPWLEATDISAQEYSLDFTDPTYTTRIYKKFAGSKPIFLLEHYRTSTGAGGQLEITTGNGEVTLRSIDDISNGESTLTLSTILGAVFIDNNRADGQPLRVIRETMDNTTTGITVILDNQSGEDFYIESIRYYPVSIVGAAFDGTCSIGTNVTADNEIEDFTPQVDFDDLLQSPGWNIGGLPTPATGVVLSTQTLGFNNKVADSTASSFQFNIVVTGYYLP